MSKDFYSGFVSIVGRPNVGKSTLMNCFIGEKIAITSNKPQTTRNKIQSILTRDDFQIIFIDTPGMHKPKSKLGEYMVKSADYSMRVADVILYLVEPYDKLSEKDKRIIEKLTTEKLKNPETAIFLVINKMDTISKPKLLTVMDSYRAVFDFNEIIPISALKNENTDMLLEYIKKNLPIGPKYFPEDMITDQPERQIIAEIVREKALYLLEDEIPHGIAVEIMSMKKRADKDIIDIEANIYCEKDSHKGMIIGKNGAKLKEIGKIARMDMERFLGLPVYLQVWVKVKKDWRDSDFLMRNFGYDSKKI